MALKFLEKDLTVSYLKTITIIFLNRFPDFLSHFLLPKLFFYFRLL